MDGVRVTLCRWKPERGPGQYCYGQEIVLDTADRVFVIDFDSRQVILLDSDIQFQRVLFDLPSFNDPSIPERLMFSRRSATLALGYSGGEVDIFRIK
jgi:hypothetical protein